MGTPPQGVLSGVYVLVVDDNADARDIFQAILRYFGAFVITASSARDARNKLVQVRADVVLCDVQLGDADAMWLIGEVRSRRAGTRFIAVSGQDYDERDLRAAGFVAYLRKPVPHETLLATVLAALKP